MKKIIDIHGQGGNAEEAEHYRDIFPEHDVAGLDYVSQTPWEAKEEFPKLIGDCEEVTLIANSIGAFFAMNALEDVNFEKAYFISPIVDMEKLILDMMKWNDVSEKELCEKGIIGDLSWEYLCYVRENPIEWKVPTHVLYGSEDGLTSFETISAFAEKNGATLTVMEGGEHWFHTDEQMRFLDEWIRRY